MLSIRELTVDDIPELLNYWFALNPEELKEMGADPGKLPTRSAFESMLIKSLQTPIEERSSYCLVWYDDEEAIGHCNTNPTTYGEEAYMHLHLWDRSIRSKGIGTQAVRLCIEQFLEQLKLKKLYCRPRSNNSSANRVLKKCGFISMGKEVCIPGTINYEQEVELWVLEPQ